MENACADEKVQTSSLDDCKKSASRCCEENSSFKLRSSPKLTFDNSNCCETVIKYVQADKSDNLLNDVFIQAKSTESSQTPYIGLVAASDPRAWAKKDIETWLVWAHQELNTSSLISAEMLPSSGRVLCLLNRRHLEYRVGKEDGKKLAEHLNSLLLRHGTCLPKYQPFDVLPKFEVQTPMAMHFKYSRLNNGGSPILQRNFHIETDSSGNLSTDNTLEHAKNILEENNLKDIIKVDGALFNVSKSEPRQRNSSEETSTQSSISSPSYSDPPSPFFGALDQETSFYSKIKKSISVEYLNSAVGTNKENRLECSHSASSKVQSFNINSDPRSWSAEDIRTWIAWARNELCLTSSTSAELLPDTGHELCLLSRNQFKHRVGDADGIKLSIQLNVFLSVVGSALPKDYANADVYEFYRETCNRLCSYGTNSIQLWQFLLEMLSTKSNLHIIKWTNCKADFSIVDPEILSFKWGERINDVNMNYDKISRMICNYYERGFLTKSPTVAYSYRFCFPALQRLLVNQQRKNKSN